MNNNSTKKIKVKLSEDDIDFLKLNLKLNNVTGKNRVKEKVLCYRDPIMNHRCNILNKQIVVMFFTY